MIVLLASAFEIADHLAVCHPMWFPRILNCMALHGHNALLVAAERGKLSSMAKVLSPMMSLRDFKNGYWYLDQLKNFAEHIGIPAAKKLRKDELEKAIVAFLRTGKAALPTKRSLRRTGVKDVERGLNLKLRIENYTRNRETKDFIIEQACLMMPDVT